MHTLSADEQTVIREVIDGPGWQPGRSGPAWTLRARLELISGSATVAGLIARGWLDDWPDAESVTLTPWAADRLQVHLVERMPDEVEVWAPITEPERCPRCSRWVSHLPCLDFLPAPANREPEEIRPRLAGGIGAAARAAIASARGRRRPGRCLAG